MPETQVAPQIDEPTPEQLELIDMTPEEYEALDGPGRGKARTAIINRMAQRRADNPDKGHPRINPGDMTGSDPASAIVTGKMAPNLAGDRLKSMTVLARIREFINKYSSLAIDKFGGMKGPESDKRIEYRGSQGLKVAKAGDTDFGRGADVRAGRTGNVKGIEQMMSKEKAIKLLESMPMMPSSRMMQAAHILGNYIWRIHATARADLRNATKERLAARSNFPKRRQLDPKTGEYQETDQIDTDHPAYKEHLEAMSREFETDSVQVKADLNMLAAACGELRRSGGFGSAADQAFLQKHQAWKKTEVLPKDSQVRLGNAPELKSLVGDVPDQYKIGKQQDDEPKLQARKPTIRRGGMEAPGKQGAVVRRGRMIDPDDMPDELPDELSKESFDRYLDRIIEHACAAGHVRWYDEL